MASTVRVQAPIGQRALFITTLAVPLTGWTVHALTLHRQLSAARRDPLRGLLGRDGFTAEAWQITDRDGDHALVGMVDLDHFKQINDGPGGGHGAGDRVLAATAQRPHRLGGQPRGGRQARRRRESALRPAGDRQQCG
ncbi:diguanylate cyclase domain-containing protein [Streptomyces flaveolus]|uniref:diguanylate cyclase domain-containing protein n=1 Tax=Streptomyces flaveolus TaxID=67297 RepID=UPI0038274C43